MYICLVCGYNQLDQPQYLESSQPTFDICPCCGFQSGFDDDSEGISIEEYRYEWLMRGAKWKFDGKSDNWDFKEQLKNSGFYEWASKVDIGGFNDLESYKRSYEKSRINNLNKYGRSDLHRAIYYEKYDIAEFLIYEGIDINLKNARSQTALHIAVRKSPIKIVRMLIDYGAEIDGRDRLDRTPFNIIACRILRQRRVIEESYQIMELLLEHGADIASKDIMGESALNLAEKLPNDRFDEIKKRYKHLQ